MSDRYIPHDDSTLPFDPKVIPKHLETLVTKYPPTFATFHEKPKNFYGLFSGPTSVAHALYILSLRLNVEIKGKSLLLWAKDYLSVAEQMAKNPHESNMPDQIVDASVSGISNELVCWLAVAAAIRQDEAYARKLVSFVPNLDEEKDEVFDDWIAGRSGVLYLLRFVRKHLPNSASLVDPSITHIIELILRRNPYKPCWRFVDRPYLGMAHGNIGIITQILLSEPHRAAELKPWVIDIINQQLPDGNWNKFSSLSECDSYQTSEFMQMGHGAPGMVMSLMPLRHLYEEIDTSIEKAQEVIWRRGLLSKESCLQHGAAGNALVLTDPARRATFLAYSQQEAVEKGLADGSLEASSSPSGLHRGLAGRIWAMVAHERGELGVFPSFNDA